MNAELLSTNAVSIVNGHPTTTSLKVAEVFGRKHYNVIRDIEKLDCSSNFHSLNFEEIKNQVQIGKGANRSFKAYSMTKDGFVFLVMGYTGKEAARFKEAYIEAFNKMEEKLYEQENLKQLADAPSSSSLSSKFGTIVEYRGQRVISNSALTTFYRAKTDAIWNRRNYYKDVLIEGRDYFNISKIELDQLRFRYPDVSWLRTRSRRLILWTEVGARNVAMLLCNPSAASVFKQLEKEYFQHHGESRPALPAQAPLQLEFTATPKGYKYPAVPGGVQHNALDIANIHKSIDIGKNLEDLLFEINENEGGTLSEAILEFDWFVVTFRRLASWYCNQLAEQQGSLLNHMNKPVSRLYRR